MSSNKPSGSSSGSGSIPRGLLGLRGTPVGKDTRLSSLRGTRDLTLGGVRKKTFQPNIPVRREKSKEERKVVDVNQDQPASSTRHDSSRGREARGRGRGRGRGHGEVMQSHSIFEEGPSESMKHKSYRELSDRGYSTVSKGASGVRSEKMSHDVDTKTALDHLLRDNFTVNEKLDCDDPSMCPVQLPVNSQVKAETKQDVKHLTAETCSAPGIKQEPNDDDDDMVIDEEQSTGAIPGVGQLHKNVGLPLTAADLFSKAAKSEKPEFMFIQLPDTLPGEPYSDDSHTSGSKKQESDINKSLENCTLADFHEGFIGKLRIHKSGHTTLKLGNTILKVQLGTPPGFLQDVVSLRVDDNGGDLAVLGHVPHKVLCIPDYEAMINEL